MLLISLFDFIASISYFTSTWPIPPSSTPRNVVEDGNDGNGNDGIGNVGDGIAWNIGNTTTCNIQGFIIQLSIATPM